MRHLWVAAFAWLGLSASVAAQPFLPPGILNLGGGTDTGADLGVCHLVDPDGATHAVWASQVDYTGDSGGDPDIFYSSNSGAGWSQPVRVNSYGALDSGDDERVPRLARSSDGTLHCVWQSNNPYSGAGVDWDIFHSQNSGSGWSTAELVNHYGLIDQGGGGGPNPADDTLPTIVIMAGDRVLVAWESIYPLNPSSLPPANIGSDSDIIFSILSGGVWSAATFINSNAPSDTGQDHGPVALAIGSAGDVIAVWSTNDDFRLLQPVGTDSDIVWATLPPSGSWSTLTEVTSLARSDTGADQFPVVAVIGSGSNEEIHIAWASNENLTGAGTDYDILHCVKRGFDVFPTATPAGLVNSSALTDGVGDDDLNPSLSVEPGGVLHCAWQSNADIGGAVGPDIDIFHSANATPGNAWSAADLVNLTGFTIFDGGVGIDAGVDLVCTPSGLLSVAWHSDDTVGGLAGTDFDIFHAIGAGRGISRPELINTTGETDNPAVNGGDYDMDPVIAVAPDGTLHAIWASANQSLTGGNPPIPTGADFDIFHSHRTASGWTDPDLVNTNGTIDTGRETDPAVAVDSQGHLHVVWSTDENIGGAVGTDTDIFYSTNQSGQWSAPELVNSTGTTDSGFNAPDSMPQIALRGDEVHVVWESDRDHANANNPLGNISHAVRGTGGWSTEVYINATFAPNPATAFNGYISLAVDTHGVLHAVWQSESNYSGSGTDNDIFHAMWSGSGWSVPQFVNDAGNDGAEDLRPTIVSTPDGSVYSIWTTNLNVQSAGTDLDLFISTLGTGGWGTAQLLMEQGINDAPGAADDLPCAVSDALGRLHVCWASTFDLLGTAGFDYDLFYTVINPQGTLPSASPVVLANPAGHADTIIDIEYFRSMAVDLSGRPHFVWDSDYSMGDTAGDDSDCYHSQGMAYLTFEDLLNHLLGRFALQSERLALSDRNGDGKVDAADLVHWVLNP